MSTRMFAIQDKAKPDTEDIRLKLGGGQADWPSAKRNFDFWLVASSNWDDNLDGEYVSCARGQKCIPNFSLKTWRKERAWET
jgi:hypothetical protein